MVRPVSPAAPPVDLPFVDPACSAYTAHVPRFGSYTFDALANDFFRTSANDPGRIQIWQLVLKIFNEGVGGYARINRGNADLRPDQMWNTQTRSDLPDLRKYFGGDISTFEQGDYLLAHTFKDIRILQGIKEDLLGRYQFVDLSDQKKKKEFEA